MKKEMFFGAIRITIVVFVSVLIELFIFNLEYFRYLCNDKYDKDVVYELEELSYSGWEVKEGEFISGFDPIFYITGLNKNVRNIRLEVESSQEIPYVEIFYTNNEKPEINLDLYIKEANPFTEMLEVEMDAYVKDIRFDLSDLTGIHLKNLRITFNHMEMEFGIARVIAINLIYWAYVFLFQLQKTPKYKINH